MWDERRRQRFQQLRERESLGQLTQAEQAELASLGQELERTESAYLSSATRRVREEREAVENQNSSLQTLVHRKESLVRRLRDFLEDVQAERNAIDGELAAVLGGAQGDSAKDP